MKKLKTLLIPAALLALTGLSGCNGQQTRSSGMPTIDRWISPAPMMQPTPVMPRGPIEYAEPPETIPPSPVRAPEPPGKPSALLQPRTLQPARLPNLPDLDDPRQEPLHDTYFGSESGHTPLLTN